MINRHDQIDALPFRCHALGDLMGVKGLGDTGRKRAIWTYIEMTTGRTKEIKSKYLEKGIHNESEAIKLANRVLGTKFVKNNVRVFNEYITGECDSIDADIVADFKNSWDIFTFNESQVKLNTDYEWQGRGYMELYDKPKFWLIYCLTDSPSYLVENELKKLMNENGDIENVEKAYQVITNMVYTKKAFQDIVESQFVFTRNPEIESQFIEIPEKDRVFVYKVDRNQTKTDLCYSRIKEARQFLKTKFQ